MFVKNKKTPLVKGRMELFAVPPLFTDAKKPHLLNMKYREAASGSQLDNGFPGSLLLETSQ